MKQIPLLIASSVLLTACGWLFREQIPEYGTPREQYEYANSVIMRARPLPVENENQGWRITDVESPYFEVPLTRYRDRDYRRFIRAFSEVVDRFPDDEEFTPIAKIRLGEFYHLAGDHYMASAYYRDVLSSHPDDDVLNAAALYGLARVHMAQQQFTEAQRCYTLLIENHRDSESPSVIDLVERAAQHLMQIHYQFGR